MLFEVEEISCGKCSTKIQQAIGAVDPTAHVDVDVDAGRVRVEGVLGKDQVIAALAAAGYPARKAKPHSGAGSDCCGGCS